jgi:hypothetical protein
LNLLVAGLRHLVASRQIHPSWNPCIQPPFPEEVVLWYLKVDHATTRSALRQSQGVVSDWINAEETS